MPEKKKIAVVAGASGGLGREFVRLLAQDAQIAHIWAVARSPEKLEALEREYGGRVRAFPMDMAQSAQIAQFGRELAQQGAEVDILVNAAGVAKFCDYGDITVEESLHIIHVNAAGLVAMTLACLPHMGRGGRILNIASQTAFQPLPYQNIYSATKAFVRNYTRALHIELRSRGICAVAVCPGWMYTELITRATFGAKKATRRFVGMVTPDKVAQRALRDAGRGRDMSVYSAYVKLCHVAAKLLPQRWAMELWLRQQGF